MRNLDKYSVQIEIGGQSIGDSLLAYRMDDTPENLNMRKDVGLGTCNSCDYFRVDNDCVRLIEDKRIIDKFKDLKLKYSALDDNLREKLVFELIRDENRMKVYGSMLILCRLAAKYECVKSKLTDKPVKFYLVVGAISGEDAKFFDDFRHKLHNDLKSMLTAQIVADVAILNSDQLKAKLSSN